MDSSYSILIVTVLIVFFIGLIIEDLSKCMLLPFLFRMFSGVHAICYVKSRRHISRPLPTHFLGLFEGLIVKRQTLFSWRVINLTWLLF